jgi:hypothetical protein
LICASFGLPFGYCSTSTLVILPPLIVSRTWTGPHWVSATEPVTVVDLVDFVVELEDPLDEPLPLQLDRLGALEDSNDDAALEGSAPDVEVW